MGPRRGRPPRRADALRATYAASDSTDGYVAVWLDPGRANDPGRAVAAARELAGDVRRANVAAAFAWSPTRAAVVEALVAEGMAVALSGVRDAGARDAVAAAAGRGAATLRSKAAAADEDDAVAQGVQPRPVFVLGGEGGADGVLGVRVSTEFGLFAAGRASGPARLPLSPDAEEAGLKAAVGRLAQRATLPARDDAYTPVSYAQAVPA